jgi:hypothetical protein
MDDDLGPTEQQSPDDDYVGDAGMRMWQLTLIVVIGVALQLYFG